MNNSRRYECPTCGYVYDESEGFPQEGIEPGTAFADIDESWLCPDCSAIKDEFVLQN